MWIWGTGGHAKVVRQSYGLPIDFTVDDANPELPWKEQYRGYHGIIAIGDNKARKAVADRLGEAKFRGIADLFAAVRCDYKFIHYIGNFLGPNAVVGVDTVLGNHVIINTGASVDHDCKIGDFVHIAPGAHLCGNVEVGDGAFVGAGTIVTPGSKIEPWAFIKAGSLVTPNRIVARF